MDFLTDAKLLDKKGFDKHDASMIFMLVRGKKTGELIPGHALVRHHFI